MENIRIPVKSNWFISFLKYFRVWFWLIVILVYCKKKLEWTFLNYLAIICAMKFCVKLISRKKGNIPLHQQEQKSGSCFLIVSLSFWLSSKDSRFVKSSFDDFLELLVFVIIFSVEPLLVVVNKGGSCLFGLPMGASDMCRLLEESSRSVLPWPKKRKMSNRKCLGFSREINVN